MRRSVLISGLAGMLLIACSGSILGPGASQVADMREMKYRILELEKDLGETDAEIAALREQVAELERRLEESRRAERLSGTTGPRASSAPAGAMAEGISPPLVDSGIEESDLEVADVSPQPARQEPQPGSSEAPPAGPIEADEAEAAEATPTEPRRAVEPAAQALYDRGYTLYHQGQYVEAEASFQRFLQAYAETDLADNAQYWIGESRFARGDLQGALSAFRETVERFPDGNKVADAMIKEGDSLAGLGDLAGARSRYEEVVRRFPGSAAALMGEERLAGLR